MIASNVFFHNNIEYDFKWAIDRHATARIPQSFNQSLQNYFELILSKNVPHSLFNDPKILRCSTFRIKGLQRGALKIASENLIKEKAVILINPRKKSPSDISPAIVNLPKIAHKAYTNFVKEFHQNPGHDPILYRILYENQNALSLETPIWTTPQTTLKSFLKISDPFSFSCKIPFTGHIDLIMFDEKDENLVVADYKPEGEFLKSLPQVSIYGLVLKRMLHLKNIKCVSFSKEEAWLYDPEILKNEVITQIQQFGDPKLPWRQIIRNI